MKRPNNNAFIDAVATATLLAAMNKPLDMCPLLPLLQVICEVLDLAADGEDIFVTFGKTRNKSALVLTVTWDGDKTFVAAGSVSDLATNAISLLAED